MSVSSLVRFVDVWVVLCWLLVLAATALLQGTWSILLDWHLVVPSVIWLIFAHWILYRYRREQQRKAASPTERSAHEAE